MKNSNNELEKSSESYARSDATHARLQDSPDHHRNPHAHFSYALQEEIWNERTQHGPAPRAEQKYGAGHEKKSGGDYHTKTKPVGEIKLPPTVDPTEERKKLTAKTKKQFMTVLKVTTA